MLQKRIKSFLFLCISFFYSMNLFSAPAVTSLTPKQGPAAGGNVVLIAGTGFIGTTSVNFGTEPATFLVVDDANITALAPSGIPQNVNVTVSNGVNTSPISRNDLYTYQGDGFVYVTQGVLQTITPINLRLNIPGAPILFPFNTKEPTISPDSKDVYVPSSSTNDMQFLDRMTGTINPVTGITQRVFFPVIAPNGMDGYVANLNNASGGGVFTVDFVTNNITGQIPFNAPRGLAINPNGLTAYATTSTEIVTIPNDFPSTPLGSIAVTDGTDITISPDGLKAYVAQPNLNSITPIDLTTNTPLPPILTTDSPQKIDITPDGKTLVYTMNGGFIVFLDLATNTTRTFGGAGLKDLAITPDSKTAYTIEFNSDTVIYFDIATGASSTIAILGANNLAITPDQSPVARFKVTPAFATTPTSFDASESASPVGTIANYHWNFGDGTTLDSANPVVTHTYATAGSFSATLTVTNTSGTSTFQIYTGKIMNNNGSLLATVSGAFAIATAPAPPPPPPIPPIPTNGSHFKGKVIKNAYADKTEYIHQLKWIPSTDREVVNYLLFRNDVLIAEITPAGPFVFRDRHRRRHSQDTYTLIAVGSNGQQSLPLKVVLPK
jgi:PKD repeat protein